MLASRMRAVAIRTRSLAPTVSSLFHTSSPSSSSSLYTNTGNSYSNALFTQRQHTYQQQQRYFSTEEGDEGEAEVEEELYYELKKSSKGNLPFHTHFTDEVCAYVWMDVIMRAYICKHAIEGIDVSVSGGGFGRQRLYHGTTLTIPRCRFDGTHVYCLTARSFSYYHYYHFNHCCCITISPYQLISIWTYT